MRFDLSVLTSSYLVFAHGLLNTLVFSALGIVGGLLAGSLAAVARLSRRRLLRSVAVSYVELFRNTPFLVQVFVFYYVLPQFGLSLPVVAAGLLALSLFSGAYMCESIRGAISSVPRGQVDAARATGMSYPLTMRRIVVPQMVHYLVPPLTNNMIGVVKDSAILSVITVPELAMAAQVVVGETFGAAEVFAVSALLYWLTCGMIETGMRRLHRRFKWA